MNRKTRQTGRQKRPIDRVAIIEGLQPSAVRDFWVNACGVDPYGADIMAQKLSTRAVYIYPLSGLEANILKQEMLSLGGDAAIPRSAIMDGRPIHRVMLLGTSRQMESLCAKLEGQPFQRMKELAREIRSAMAGLVIEWQCGDARLEFGEAVVMGILNITDDSFSGDGVLDVERAVERAKGFLEQGAAIIDIGAMSTRPGSREIPVDVEKKRVSLVLKELMSVAPDAVVSVDTYRWQVAEAALRLGAKIVNDITGLKNKNMRALIKDSGAGAVIMHMKGMPKDMQENPYYDDVVSEVFLFIEKRMEQAVAEGIAPKQIAVDVGIGFGKRLEDNYALLNGLPLFCAFGRPIVLGVSRKSFIGRLDGSGPDMRIGGTIAANMWGVKSGAHIIRVHDCAEHIQALKVWQRISSAGQ